MLEGGRQGREGGDLVAFCLEPKTGGLRMTIEASEALLLSGWELETTADIVGDIEGSNESAEETCEQMRKGSTIERGLPI